MAESDIQSLTNIFTLSNPVFRIYLICVSILVLKVLFSVLLVARQRFKKRIFISPEDVVLVKDAEWGKEDPDIERCRRAHLNDLENIPFFFATAFVFMCTNPAPWLAQALFLTYTVSRIVYTVVYAMIVMPQPTRVIVWGVGCLITLCMAVYSVFYLLTN